MWHVATLCVALLTIHLSYTKTWYHEHDITEDCSRLVAVDNEYGGLLYAGTEHDKYGKGLNCTVMVRGQQLPTAQRFTNFQVNVGFTFKRWDVPDKWPWSGICEDYVEIYEKALGTVPLTKKDPNMGVCKDDVVVKDMSDYYYATTDSDTALVRFVSDMAVEGTGFELIYTSFYPSGGSSCFSDGEFFCTNGNCIASSLQCDKLNNCGDNSDEENCEYAIDPVDVLTKLRDIVLRNYALVIACMSMSVMLMSIVVAFCTRVVCKDTRRSRRAGSAKKKPAIMIGADGKPVNNPNLQAPIIRKNVGL